MRRDPALNYAPVRRGRELGRPRPALAPRRAFGAVGLLQTSLALFGYFFFFSVGPPAFVHASNPP